MFFDIEEEKKIMKSNPGAYVKKLIVEIKEGNDKRVNELLSAGMSIPFNVEGIESIIKLLEKEELRENEILTFFKFIPLKNKIFKNKTNIKISCYDS